jgi:hypothetical protein
MKKVITAYISTLSVICFVIASGKSQTEHSAHKTVAASSFTFSGNGVSQATIPNVSVSLSTSGRPIFLGIVPQVPDSSPDWQPYSINLIGDSNFGMAGGTIAIVRDSSVVVASFSNGLTAYTRYSRPASLGSLELPPSMDAIDSAPPGTHVYTVEVSGLQGRCEIRGARLVAYEM